MTLSVKRFCLSSMALLGFGLWACGPKTVAAGSSGAFGIVNVNGKQKLYLPLPDLNSANHGQIAVVDVGLTGNGISGADAQITLIDLGTADIATTTGGDASGVIAASTFSPTVWFIDPTQDKVTKTISLDPSAGPSSFSGGGGFVTGIADDSANHRAILSVWNGFALLDTNNQTISSVIQVPPSENFGFDSVHQRIVAPFYACASSADAHGVPPSFCGNFKAPNGATMNDGLNVIDLKDNNTVYTFQDSAAPAPAQPVGSEPDAAAVDPNTGVAVVPSELSGYENIIDLGNAHFDKGSLTVTAPHHRITSQTLTGVAVESSRHYAFFEEEHSQDVGLVDLNAANQGTGNFQHGFMPALPDGTGWSNMGDPHGIAVTTGISSGRSVGFVVEPFGTWVARIDLQTMSGLASTPTILQTDMAKAVTYLNARKHP